MIPLPDWAPNVHPMVIHFPIALLVVAVLVDGAGVVLRKHIGIRAAAVALFALGALAALAAFFTGDSAADTVRLSAAAQAVLSEHENWATRTVWFFGLFTLARLVLLWFDNKERPWTRGAVHVGAILLGASGLFFLVQTGDRGARMVFEYGVGVAAASADNTASNREAEDHADSAHSEGPSHDRDMLDGMTASATLRRNVAADGSWRWTPGPGAESSLANDFLFLKGSVEDLNAVLVDSGSTLRLRIEAPAKDDSMSIFFVSTDLISNVQTEVDIDAAGFDGTVQLVYNVLDAQNYDFLGLQDGLIRQGRITEGQAEVFDEKALRIPGWLSIRAVSDGRHSRGYADEQLLVHGHGSPAKPGAVGLHLQGIGVVQLKSISAQPLR